MNRAQSDQASPRVTKPIWVQPWGYREGAWIAGGLLLVGFALQWVGGGLQSQALAWPVNVVVALVFSGILVLVHVVAPQADLVVWLRRIPATICALALVTVLALLMGLVLQDDEAAAPWIRRLGLASLTTSWPFLFGMCFFLATLGMATVNRLIPCRLKDIGFLLNHLGLYVAVLAGLMGAPDVERWLMELREGELVWTATNAEGHAHEMPLALELIRFEKEEFAPKLVKVETDTHRIVPDTLAHVIEIGDEVEGRIGAWDVTVLRFHALAMPIGDRYEPVFDQGAGPAARIRAVHDATGEVREGWITCGSFAFPHELLAVDDDLSLAMTVPRASAYRSRAILYTPDADAEEIVIEVNRPYAAAGWKLYQYSYDDRFGRWSRTSIIECIRDPWLPVVYGGIYMLLAGAVYLMFMGRKPWSPPPEKGQEGRHATV